MKITTHKKKAKPQPVVIDGEALYEKANMLFMDGKYNECIPYFEQSGACDYWASFLRLGRVYRGEMAEPNHTLSTSYFKRIQNQLPWFEEKARQSSDGMLNLGLLYVYPEIFGEQNEKKAQRYFRQAAVQGNPRAQYHLGVCLTGTDSYEWYKVAADRGDLLAQYNLSVCLLNGFGIKKNPEEGTKYYHLAATRGHASARNNLAVCYREGTGVPKDMNFARFYEELASDVGHDLASQRLVGLGYRRGSRTGLSRFQGPCIEVILNKRNCDLLLPEIWTTILHLIIHSEANNPKYEIM